MVRLEEKKFIQPIEILSCYESSGIPNEHQSNGLKFHWYSWVLCEVAHVKSNPIHHAIFTNFRCDNYETVGPAKDVTVTMWNPSYEGEEHREDVDISKLHYWKPITVVHDES